MNKQIAKDKFFAMKQMMEKYDLQTTAITSYIESIDDFKVTSPLVGRFSTGKSSLLNGLLGKNIYQKIHCQKQQSLQKSCMEILKR